MQLPVLENGDTECGWIRLSEVEFVEPVSYGGQKNKQKGFVLPDQGRIGFPRFLSEWSRRGFADDYLFQLILRFGHVDVKENALCFSIDRSQSRESGVSEYIISEGIGYVSLLRYVGNASDLLSAQAPI